MFHLQAFNLARRQHQPQEQRSGFEIANKLPLILQHHALGSGFKAFA
jgi:hypothetical protein